jgi:hypothetical protein
LCRCKIGARFAPNIPQAQESFWTHPMVLLDDEAQVEACFYPFRDSANLDARWVHCLHRTYHKGQKSFCMHLMELLCDVHHVKSRFDPFGNGVSVNAR